MTPHWEAEASDGSKLNLPGWINVRRVPPTQTFFLTLPLVLPQEYSEPFVQHRIQWMRSLHHRLHMTRLAAANSEENTR